MGYLLFTARKLSLNSRINQANARLMLLGSQEEHIDNQIAQAQSFKSLQTSAANNNAYSIFEQNMSQYSSDDPNYNALYLQEYMKLQQSLNMNEAKANMSNSQINALEAQASQIDLQKKRLETQLEAMTAELDKVTQTEESAIKASAPKFKSAG